MIIKIPDELIDLSWGRHLKRDIFINTKNIVSIECYVTSRETWNSIDKKINKGDYKDHYTISICLSNGTIYGLETLKEPTFTKVLSWINQVIECVKLKDKQ